MLQMKPGRSATAGINNTAALLVWAWCGARRIEASPWAERRKAKPTQGGKGGEGGGDGGGGGGSHIIRTAGCLEK